MSLSTALNIANGSIFNTGRQTSILSRNVQESNNPDYTRRTAVLASTAPGAQVVQIQRTTDDQLFRQNLSALSVWSGQSTLSSGLEQLEVAINGVDGSTSAATAIGKLQEALQIYSASPSSRSVAESAVEAARQVARVLNDGTNALQAFRIDTEKQIGTAVADLNKVLAEFQEVNDAVVLGTRSGRDVSDALDRRDALLKKIADYVPVTTLTREGNDMALFTTSGATLFERVPRTVAFQASASLGPGTVGNRITVDGVPVPFGSGGNTDSAGKLAGLLQLRDGVATTIQRQLDEVARGLITSFSETSQSAGPSAAGLFTWSGAPTVPPAGTLVDGLAGMIRLNAAFDSGSGGNPHLLRDGGANGADYVANTTGAASFTALLNDYYTRLDTPQAFDATAGAGTGLSVGNYAAASVGWFQSVRKDSDAAAGTKEALAARTSEALSNATGVNVDAEMSKLLELEHSYEASARLIKAVDEMLATLLAAVG